MKRFFLLPILILASHLCIARVALAGPISPARGIVIVPQWRASRSDTAEMLGAMSGWGSVYHGFNSTDDAFGWCVDFGVIFEIARWSESASLLVISDMEFTAKTNNNVGINPSGAIWEEGMLFDKRCTGFDWQFGYLNHCRHDIDNGVFGQYSVAPLRRTLIYGSFIGRVMSQPFQMFRSSDSLVSRTRAWLTLDLTPFRSDYRQPYEATGVFPDFRDLLFTLGGNVSVTLCRVGPGVAYFRGGANLTGYGSPGSYFHSISQIDKATLDWRTEIGYQTEGKAGCFQIYAGAERYQDDESNPFPENSQFAVLGIRLSGISLTE
jgi:hypothetical protein